MTGPRYVKVPTDLVPRMLDAVRPDVALLNLAAWSEASQWMNDGHFTRAGAQRLPGWTRIREDRLVSAGFWRRIPDGIEVVGYLDCNASAEAIQRARRRMAEGGQRSGSEAAATRQRDPRRGHFVREAPEVGPEVPLGPLPLPIPLAPQLPSLPTLPEGWEGFGAEWAAFAQAWRRRGFRLPPKGAEDGAGTQRAVLWPIVRDYPSKVAAWVDAAPAGASSFDVVAHVQRLWRVERERIA